MTTLKEIQKQISGVDGASKFLGRGEIKQLPQILSSDESVQKLVQGWYDSGNGKRAGILVATNRRVIFIDKGLFRLYVKDIGLDKLSSI